MNTALRSAEAFRHRCRRHWRKGGFGRAYRLYRHRHPPARTTTDMIWRARLRGFPRISLFFQSHCRGSMSSSARVRQDDRIGLDTYPSCQEFGVRARARAESAPFAAQRPLLGSELGDNRTLIDSLFGPMPCHIAMPCHAQHNAIMMRIRRHHLWQVAVRQGRTFRRRYNHP